MKMRYFILALIVAIAQLGTSSLVPIPDHGTGLDNGPETNGPLRKHRRKRTSPCTGRESVNVHAAHPSNAQRYAWKNASTKHNTLRKRGTGFGVFFNLVKQNLWYGWPWSPDWTGWDCVDGSEEECTPVDPDDGPPGS